MKYLAWFYGMIRLTTYRAGGGENLREIIMAERATRCALQGRILTTLCNSIDTQHKDGKLEPILIPGAYRYLLEPVLAPMNPSR